MDARPCAERNHRSPRTLAPPSLSRRQKYRVWNFSDTTFASTCGQVCKSFTNLGKPRLRPIKPHRTHNPAGGEATTPGRRGRAGFAAPSVPNPFETRWLARDYEGQRRTCRGGRILPEHLPGADRLPAFSPFPSERGTEATNPIGKAAAGGGFVFSHPGLPPVFLSCAP